MTPLREVLQRWSRVALWLGLLGGVAALVGLCLDPAAFARAWLLAFVAWVGLPLGALGFRMLHGLCGGEWGRAVGGVLDAMLRTMPVMVVLFVPLLLGMGALYPWMRADFAVQPELAHQTAYLNGPGFALRGLGFLVGWAVLGRLVVNAQVHRLGAICAVGLVAWTLSGTLVALDWIMSLDPAWTSRVFGILFLVGQSLAAFAFAVAVAAWTAARPDAAWRPEKKTLRDLGNLLQAFLLLWVYLEFMQLLVIWNGNLPRAIPWYLARSAGIWLGVSVALAVLHFAVPFALLLFRANKEDPRRLGWIAVWLLLMRLLDDCWTVLPAFGAGVHWLDVAVPLAMGGVVVALILRALPSRLPEALALVPGGAAMTVQRHDERPAAVFGTAVSFALIVLVSIGVAVWCGTASGRPPLQGPEVRGQADAFPRPRLQDEPRAELHALQRARQSVLEQWAWLDAAHERCRVPVDVAVDALLARGFELDR